MTSPAPSKRQIMNKQGDVAAQSTQVLDIIRDGGTAIIPLDVAYAIVGNSGEAIARSPSHNPENPTAKTWLYQRYRIPAMTYETGDDTPPERIERIARAAALTLMEELSSISMEPKRAAAAADAPAAKRVP